MSYKKGTYISLLFITAVGILFYAASMALPSPQASQDIGPDYFPKIISVLLVICCVINFFTTKKKKDEHLEMRNLGLIMFTVILMILFVAVWGIVGKFYVISFIFLTILIYVYNQAKHSLKKILISSAISLGLTLFVYVIFDRLLYISF